MHCNFSRALSRSWKSNPNRNHGSHPLSLNPFRLGPAPKTSIYGHEIDSEQENHWNAKDGNVSLQVRHMILMQYLLRTDDLIKISRDRERVEFYLKYSKQHPIWGIHEDG